MWPEVKIALDENKRELNLSGKVICSRIETDGLLDPTIFKIINLNLLRISDCNLRNLPEDIAFLVNLQSLLLYGNDLEKLPSEISTLQKLKVLDFSRNKISEFAVGICKLANVETINLSSNSISEIPADITLEKLTFLNLSHNNICDVSNLCRDGLVNLTNLNLKSNKIESIPKEILKLHNLKVLDLSENKIKEIPKAVGLLNKLKELELAENPIADKRLLKLVKQCRSKQVIDYVREHGSELLLSKDVGKISLDESNAKLLFVKKYSPDVLTVVYDDNVKSVRPYILCCIIRNISFSAELLKKFLQLQSKIHDTVCARREKSVVATHDLALLKTSILNYTAKGPNDIFIHPLGGNRKISATALYNNLKAEAEALRKEKKRNVYSAIHKFLYLLENKDMYTCLQDTEGNVLSLHPLTNSETSKISISTTDIFIEVSSSTDMKTCRLAMEMLITETYNMMNLKKLIIQQVKITDKDGNLKNVYPSKIDLQLEKPFLVEIEKH